MINFKNNKKIAKLADQVSDGIVLYILPFGSFILLTGLFWLGDRGLYKNLFNLFVVVPTLLAIILDKGANLKRILRNPLLVPFLIFGVYTLITLFWSDTQHSIASLVKRPINILFLTLAFGLVALRSEIKLFKIVTLSARVAVACGLLSLICFSATHYMDGGTFGDIPQFYGYGALINPLLTSHVYGFFTAFFLALWFSGRYTSLPLQALSFGILTLVVLSTGSRTPLLALMITLIWLSICYGNRRSLTAIGVALTSFLALILLYPKAVMERGLSYRPEIWMEAIKHGFEKFWFGHGFDHSVIFHIETTKKVFNDPHNIELGVFIEGGFVGLSIWLALYTMALLYAWRNRANYHVMIASALLVFGLAAGLTEGGAFMSRPKEHWFLIWIPFALLYSTRLVNTHPKEVITEKSGS